MLRVTFRRVMETPALREAVERKVARIQKLVKRPLNVHVRLFLDKAQQVAEIAFRAEHKAVVAVARTKNLYESLESATKRVVQQLQKERAKHRGKAAAHEGRRPRRSRQGRDVGEGFPHEGKRRPVGKPKKKRVEFDD